jgi:hypothetical protein
MKKNLLRTFFIIIFVGIMCPWTASGEDLRFPVGLSYVTGFGDVNDSLETSSMNKGTGDDTGYIPVNISFQPYIQLDNGLRFGAGIGPVMATFGDVSYYDVPLNINAGYTFNPDANISPYFRAGLINHVLSGDYVIGSNPAVFGAIGIEFFRNRSAGIGIELSYDTSRIRLERITRTYWYDVLSDQITSYIHRNKGDEKVGLAFSLYVIF